MAGSHGAVPIARRGATVSSLPNEQPGSAMSSPSQFRDYLVTATPGMVTYAGAWQVGEYTVTVAARSRTEAIAMVRKGRRDEDGRHGVPHTFRARLAPPERGP